MPKKKFGFKSKTTSASVPKTEYTQTQQQDTKPFSNPVPSNLLFPEDEQSICNMEDQTVPMNSEILNSLRIFNLKKCTVYTGAVLGSIFIDDCTDCTLFLASQQVTFESPLLMILDQDS